MWLPRCGIFVRILWMPCSYCMASFCGSTGKPKSPDLVWAHMQLQNLPGCAILTWHAGLAPETGFSAPSKEQLWDSITTYTASLLCAPCFALKQIDLQNFVVLCPVGR